MVFLTTSCGIKGSPMPKIDSEYIKPSVYQDVQEPQSEEVEEDGQK